MSTVLLKLTSDASVRGMIAPDGSHRFSVYDFITVACQKSDKGDYARKLFSRLVSDDSDYKDETMSSCHSLQFPGGRGPGPATPTMTLRGLQRLLLHLGTKIAAEFRTLLEGTFTRVMAGDTSLIEVIQSNAESDAPLQQAYRQALAQEPVARESDNNPLKRKREEAELYKLQTEAVCLQVNTQLACMDKYTLLCTNTVLDETAKEMFKKVILTSPVFHEETAAAITDLQAKLKAKDDLIIELQSKVVAPKAPPTNNGEAPVQPLVLDPALMVQFNSVFTFTEESQSQIEEKKLYDAFFASIPADKREHYLELMYTACHPGKSLFLKHLKWNNSARVGKSSFKKCLLAVGGNVMKVGCLNGWTNVKIN